ncbi:MAG: PKD domain-containing protein [Bacteroidales bacterium]|nr:PKD domain-containing protein [Bacteroidales bacterium]
MKHLILSIVFLFTIHAYAQHLPCKTPEINKWAEENNPLALQSKKELEQFTQKYISKSTKEDTIIIIPVVFHIVHNYGAENISKEQVLDAIRVINEDFRKLNADTSDIIPEFKAIAADCKIEFRLAKIDPNGNCTDGIDRVVSTLTYNADENTKMIAPSWDRTKYLNIWTVASIANGAAGYSYYPSSVNGSWGVPLDGVLILANYVGSIGTGQYSRARALTHEIGHYLNLMHPWGNSNTPGLAENCNDDDEVTDTPNTIGHTSCDLYAVTCGSLDNVQNYMEYAYCDRMFTEGQKLRMRAALHSSISGRNNLWTQQNLIATGVANNTSPAICEPIADFTYNKKFGCVNNTIQYTNLTWHTDSISSIEWTFQGGTPATSNEQNPIVSYPNAGIFSASLTVSNPAGNSTITKNNIIQIQDPNYLLSPPWTESFEDNNFPYFNDLNYSWFISGNATNHWNRTTNASYTGTACLVAPNNLNQDNEITEIATSNIAIAGQNTSNIIKFKVAYAQIDENSTDRLDVYASFNCGQTWYPRLSKSGSLLQSTNGVFINNFVPQPEQWKEEFISIGTFLNKPYIRLKFVATSHNGNPIYIDDIQLDQASDINFNSFDAEYLPTIFPNPINENSKLWLKTNKEENLNLKVNNIVGQCIINKNIVLNNGENTLTIHELNNLPSGIYFISLTINEKSSNLKIIIP